MHNRGGGKTKKGKNKARERERNKDKLEYYVSAYQFSEAGGLTIMLCPVYMVPVSKRSITVIYI